MARTFINGLIATTVVVSAISAGFARASERQQDVVHLLNSFKTKQVLVAYRIERPVDSQSLVNCTRRFQSKGSQLIL